MLKCCMVEFLPQVRGGKLEKVDEEMVEAVAHLIQVKLDKISRSSLFGK